MKTQTQIKKTKKHDFVEILFTGYHDGKVFDSNIPEDLKTLSEEAKPEKTVVIIGEKMVVAGLDKALEDKELNKEYKVHLSYKEGFGERKRELVKTIPLNVFTKQKINPYPGATLMLDNMLARIITVSGARVITDFNNPLSGKELDYKFKIIRFVEDEKEKIESFFKGFFKFVPEFTLSENNVIVKGPKVAKVVIDMNKEKFNEIFNKELDFEEDKPEEITTSPGKTESYDKKQYLDSKKSDDSNSDKKNKMGDKVSK